MSASFDTSEAKHYLDTVTVRATTCGAQNSAAIGDTGGGDRSK
jgi:hypothetical protein